MAIRQPAKETKQVRAVSSPGGLARQFRVQFQPAESRSWRVFGSYRHRQQAESALARLHQQGYATRLVECRTCPAAG